MIATRHDVRMRRFQSTRRVSDRVRQTSRRQRCTRISVQTSDAIDLSLARTVPTRRSACRVIISLRPDRTLPSSDLDIKPSGNLRLSPGRRTCDADRWVSQQRNPKFTTASRTHTTNLELERHILQNSHGHRSILERSTAVHLHAAAGLPMIARSASLWTVPNPRSLGSVGHDIRRSCPGNETPISREELRRLPSEMSRVMHGRQLASVADACMSVMST